MSSFLERLGGALGRAAGPHVRKGKWVWQAFFGSQEEMLAAESRVGSDIAHALTHDMPRDPDGPLQQRVSSIGERLALCVKNKKRTFAFQVLAAELPNALALPGGRVFVTRPLLDLVEENADQIAFILGHEMGHVIKQHAIERVMTDATLCAAVRALPSTRVVGGLVKSSAGRLLQSAYSRDREFEADRLGVALARAAHFDTTAATRLFERLARVSPTQAPLAQYFSTHPPLKDRIAVVRRFLEGH